MYAFDLSEFVTGLLTRGLADGRVGGAINVQTACKEKLSYLIAPSAQPREF